MKADINQNVLDFGEMPSGWDGEIFSEAVDINPVRNLRKGQPCKFISMADLREHNKKIQGYVSRKYAGGSRFANNDTLMARITPCLENGKTAYVDILETNEIAGGSAEFIVLSGKEGKTIDQFVYYLVTSPYVRDAAIKAMTGTSGRQRVDGDVFNKLLVALPPHNEQKAVAKILSDLDEKIELNQRMIKTLEAIAQALFKRWFVDLEFPGYQGAKFKNGLPENWREGKLADICDIIMGQSPPGETYNESGEGMPFYQGNRDFGYRFPTPRVFCSAPTRFAESGDILISVRAPVGALNIAREKCCIGRGLAALRMRQYSNGFLLYFLYTQSDLWDRYNSEGTVFGCLNKSEFSKIDIIVPAEGVLRQFDALIVPIEENIRCCEYQNRQLMQIRDSLLPKLMSGEIRVNSGRLS